MKIDYAIVSSDKNPLYLDFWEIVRYAWIKIGIKPILVFISDKDDIEIHDDYIIHSIKEIENINTGFQSQISRMYISRYYKNSVLLTSDIDMIPLSKSFFNNITNDIEDTNLAILSSDAYGTGRYPICYNVAKGKTYCDILDSDCSFEIYCKKLETFGWGWNTDELYFGLMVDKYDQNKIVKIKRGWGTGIADRRIDRVRWSYNIEKINSGFYIDCHSKRPFGLYKNELEKLISRI
jgi:hypothetical protein